MKRAVIFSGGDSVSPETIKSNIRPGDFFICCDSGSMLAKSACITPDIVMGDFDSSDYNTFSDSVKKITFPVEKDYTDTHLALKYAMENAYNDITIIGGLGGRLDHELANISILYEAFSCGAVAKIVSDLNIVTLVTKDKPFTVTKDDVKNSYVSVLPLGADAKGLSIKGFKYNLDNYDLSNFDNLCTSNELTGDTGTITVKDGFAFVIISVKN